MQDKTLQCRDCGNSFVFTVSEQQFFADKGFTNEPSRCPSCRSSRRASGGGGGGSRGRRQDREMFPAVCAECGKATEVPFQPRTDRPVYCADCFASRKPDGGGASGSFRR